MKLGKFLLLSTSLSVLTLTGCVTYTHKTCSKGEGTDAKHTSEVSLTIEAAKDKLLDIVRDSQRRIISLSEKEDSKTLTKGQE